MSIKKQVCTVVIAAGLWASLAHADFQDTYSNDFSSGGGSYYGSAFVTTFNGHSDLQLVSDGQSGTHGTWQSGIFGDRNITGFNASFKFSYNTNGNGGVGDGFSFLFGDMTDMSEQRWEGGEYGVNAFNDQGSGMSIGFDSYGPDSGIHARWGSTDLAWTNFGTEWWDKANYGDYDQALDDYNQGTINIIWDQNTGLQVGIAWPGYDMWWGLDTGYFTGDVMDNSNFSFGFAARNGGIDNDVLIDDFNVDYNYVPGPGALALLATLGFAARRRRD